MLMEENLTAKEEEMFEEKSDSQYKTRLCVRSSLMWPRRKANYDSKISH